MATPDKLNMHLFEPPPIFESEKLIAEKAPAAIRVLQKLDATDLYEALGITAEHLKGLAR